MPTQYWVHYLAGGLSDDESYDGGQPQCRKGCSQPPVRVPGVDGHGHGNMQVGLLLSLTEDPPQALFSGRSVSSGALPRPFGPTAHQRWITMALQYLKEMAVIATRNAEVTAGKASAEKATSSSGADAAAPKKKQKGKGGGRSQKANRLNTMRRRRPSFER